MSFLVQLFSLFTSAKGAVLSAKGAINTAKGAITTVKGAQKAMIEKEWAKAQQGNADAQFDIGERFYEGRGVRQDYTAAAQWFGRAAQQGHAKAQVNLGMMCFLGRGMPVDHVKAIQWLTLASWQKNEAALRAWRTAVRKATPDQVRQGQELAEQFLPKKETLG